MPEHQPEQPCRHCPHKIRLDGRGNWVHVDIHVGYSCRDADRAPLSTYAQPLPPWPALVNERPWESPPPRTDSAQLVGPFGRHRLNRSAC